MGGRGSLGGSRSTYRGGDTALFRERQLKSLLDAAIKKDGGGNSKVKEKKKGSADTGGVDGGSNKKGDGDTVADTPDTLAHLENADEQYELFSKSDVYKAFAKRINDSWSDEKYEQEERKAFNNWKASQSAKAPSPAATGAAPAGAKPMDGVRRLPKVAETLDEMRAALVQVNPKYADPFDNLSTPDDPTSRSNSLSRVDCQRCVVAGEAIDQGYDVEAVGVETGYKPAPWVEWTDENGVVWGKHDQNALASNPQIAKSFVKADGTNPIWQYATGRESNPFRANQIEQMILAWGEGGRGVVYLVYKKTGGAHVFRARVKDGQVVYMDGQDNSFGAEVSEGENTWKLAFDPTQTIGVLRTDNTTITAQGKTWLRERSIEQVNAPTSQELTSKISHLTYEEQIIWTHVWQQVRSGDNLTLPHVVPQSLDGLIADALSDIPDLPTLISKIPDLSLGEKAQWSTIWQEIQNGEGAVFPDDIPSSISELAKPLMRQIAVTARAWVRRP